MYDYTDLQVQASDPNNPGQLLIRNAAEADIQGLEVDVSALFVENLQFDLSLSWLDAVYQDFETIDGATGGVVNLEGNQMPNAPEFTLSAGAEYRKEVVGWGNYLLRIDYYYSTENFLNEFNSAVRQEAYSIVNARASFESSDGDWKLSLFGRNLTDELVFVTGFASPFFFGDDGFIAVLAPPRTYGMELEYNF